jgi:hypothetical protein
MIHQAWGAYGTIWPVIHQQLGVRPDLGRGTLEIVPQLPPDSPGLSANNVLMGDGTLAVSASANEGVYTTTATPSLTAKLAIGHTLPKDAEVATATLDGETVPYDARETNRGMEVVVEAGQSAGERTLVITTPGASVPETGGVSPLAMTGAAFMLAGLLTIVLFGNRRSGDAR